MTNNELFGVFASQVLATLHEAFPVPCKPARSEMATLISAQDAMWSTSRQLTTVEGMETILGEAGLLSPELAAKAQEKRLALEAAVATQKGRLATIQAAYDGTIAFLTQEGFIREVDSSTYQLTAKGLSHLNKQFDRDGIVSSTTAIQSLRDALRPDKFFGSLTSGTLVSLATRILGA